MQRLAFIRHMLFFPRRISSHTCHSARDHWLSQSTSGSTPFESSFSDKSIYLALKLGINTRCPSGRNLWSWAAICSSDVDRHEMVVAAQQPIEMNIWLHLMNWSSSRLQLLVSNWNCQEAGKNAKSISKGQRFSPSSWSSSSSSSSSSSWCSCCVVVLQPWWKPWRK